MAVRTRRSAEGASDDTESMQQHTHRSMQDAADEARNVNDEGRRAMSDNLESQEQAGQAAADYGRKAMFEGQRMAQETTNRAASAALAALDAFNKPIAKVMDHNRIIFQKMLHAMQEESLRFVNRRLECTGRAIEHSRDCHGVAGLMAVQQEYLMDLARDCTEQTRRLADLVRELAEDGTAQLSEVAHAVTEPARAMRRSADDTSERHTTAA